MESVHRNFRPEFINRVDDFIVFEPLSISQIQKVVLLQLARLQERLRDRKIGINLSEEALEYLAHKGYDPVFGARPVKRVMRQELENPLAKMLLRGSFDEGSEIHVDLEGKRGQNEAASPVFELDLGEEAKDGDFADARLVFRSAEEEVQPPAEAVSSATSAAG